MRYKEAGQLHKDFYGALNCTIKHISDNFGVDALYEIFYATGFNVYRDIREHLMKKDISELLNFWHYFLNREHANYVIDKNGETVILTVMNCPAVEHLTKMGIEPHPEFCSQTVFVNKGICAGSPFEIETEKTGASSCIQRLQRKKK